MAHLQTTCGNTVTSKRARYQTLLRCLQSTASCCLTLLVALVNKHNDIPNTDAVRSKISSLRSDVEAYNFFYRNLMRFFPEMNLPQVIELAVTTNIFLCSLQNDVADAYEDGTFVREPIFQLYNFMLRLCDEKPILVMSLDDARGSFCSHIQESLEHFIAEQIRLRHVKFEPS